MKAISLAGFVGVCLIVASSGASAQESKSAPLAKQLVAAMEAAKLDSIAAKDPAAPDVFIGALYIQGTQLLVISGQYSAPSLLADRIAKKEYRDVYIDLSSASVAGRLTRSSTGAGRGCLRPSIASAESTRSRKRSRFSGLGGSIFAASGFGSSGARMIAGAAGSAFATRVGSGSTTGAGADTSAGGGDGGTSIATTGACIACGTDGGTRAACAARRAVARCAAAAS